MNRRDMLKTVAVAAVTSGLPVVAAEPERGPSPLVPAYLVWVDMERMIALEDSRMELPGAQARIFSNSQPQ